MVSLKHRFNNVYNETSSNDEDSDFDTRNDQEMNDNFSENKQLKARKANFCLRYSSTDYGKQIGESGRRPKVFNRNALMARENRIKKKMYVQNLEGTVETLKDENKKLSSILDNQSTVISDLRKEVKYLKNVLANSTDISKLLKSINENTGMPVATSINHNLKITESQEITNSHPWAEKTQTKLNDLDCFNFDASDGEFTTCVSSDFDNDWNDLFSGLYSPESANADMKITEDVFSSPEFTDHNYTNISYIEKNEDGVCLHITGHKVSLEFCASCSENAATVWNKD